MVTDIIKNISFILLICFGFQSIWIYASIPDSDLIEEFDLAVETMENTYQDVVLSLNQLNADVPTSQNLSDKNSQDQHKSHSHHCCHICYAYFIGLTAYVYSAILGESNQNFNNSIFYNRKITPPLRPPIV